MMKAEQTTKILIVDDHQVNIIVLRRILAIKAVDIFEAQSGEAALQLCLEHDFAVILLDVIMPGMSGFETARHLRNTVATKSIPILFITAYDMDDKQVIAAYANFSAVDFIQKPINDKILLARVNVFYGCQQKS